MSTKPDIYQIVNHYGIDTVAKKVHEEVEKAAGLLTEGAGFALAIQYFQEHWGEDTNG